LFEFSGKLYEGTLLEFYAYLDKEDPKLVKKYDKSGAFEGYNKK
jgi:hypothetical protein